VKFFSFVVYAQVVWLFNLNFCPLIKSVFILLLTFLLVAPVFSGTINKWLIVYEKVCTNENQQEDTLSVDTLGVVNSQTENSKDSVSFLSKVKEKVKIRGGMGLSTAFYQAIGIPDQRDPFYWQVAGNVEITIGQVSLPFSVTYNQQERNFTQPFNQYGVSPKYKWITTHLGYRTMFFSEYSLSGNQFLGAGVELNPENSIFKGKFLYGRFSKAVDGYYTDGHVSGTPSFERIGAGVLFSVGKPKNSISAYLFKAKDDKNSITAFANDVSIKPAENLVMGFSTVQDLSKKISFSSEINFSAYTRDTRIPESVLDGYTFINNMGDLFYANSTSTFNKAIKGEISYTEKKYKIGAVYRRVDPDYLTMGSVYLNNDFEDIQLKSNFRAIKNKLNVTLSGGSQRNNLNKDKTTKMSRLIASISGAYTISKNWTSMITFSNFNTSSSMMVVNTLDTMRYAQVTQNASAQLMYNKVLKKVRLATGLSGNYQNANVFQNQELNTNSSSRLVNANYSFQMEFLKSGLNVSANLSGAQNQSGENEVSTLGPTLVVNKRFFTGKLNSAVSVSTLKSFMNGDHLGYILNLKGSNNFLINRHHALTNTISYIKKSSDTSVSEQFIVTLGYNYVF